MPKREYKSKKQGKSKTRQAQTTCSLWLYIIIFFKNMEFSEDYWFSSPENTLNYFYITIPVLIFLDIKHCDTENSTTQIIFAQQIKTTFIFFPMMVLSVTSFSGRKPTLTSNLSHEATSKMLALAKMKCASSKSPHNCKLFFQDVGRCSLGSDKIDCVEKDPFSDHFKLNVLIL